MVRLQKPSLGRWPFTSLGQRRMFSLLGVNHFSEAGAPPLTLLFSYTLYHFISCLLYGLVPHIMPYSEIFNLCPSWHLSLYLKPTSLTPNWGCWGMDTLTIANTVFLWQHLILQLQSFLVPPLALKYMYTCWQLFDAIFLLISCYSKLLFIVHCWRLWKHFMTNQVQQHWTSLVFLPFTVHLIFHWSCTFGFLGSLFSSLPNLYL